MATLKDLLTTIISKLNSKVTTVNGASPDDNGNVEIQSGVQSDWNQNDETAIDYVKNRPFYTGDVAETLLCDVCEEMTSVGVEWYDDHGDMLAGVNYGAFMYINKQINIGDHLKFVVNGNSYICIAHDASNYASGAIYFQEEDTQRFSVMLVPTTLVETLDQTKPYIIDNVDVLDFTAPTEFKIIDDATEIVQVDTKYIPTIPAGKLPTIPAGKLPEIPTEKLPVIPTEKLPVIPIEKLPDFLFCKRKTTYSGTFDGITDGRDTFVFNGFSYYKISDFSPYSDDVLSFSGTRADGQALSTKTIGENCCEYGFFIIVNKAGACKLALTSTVTDSFTAPSTGLYAKYGNGNTFMTAGDYNFTCYYFAPIGELPTASADVKGGVKVGEGLQMDGDVLGVHKAIYVHIETFTFNEDSAFERTQEPNGKAYALDAISMQVKKPAGVTIGSDFGIAVYFGNGRISQLLYFVECRNTEEQWMLSTVENYKGLVKRTRTTGWDIYNSTSAVHEVPFKMYDNVLGAGEVITKIKTDQIIPAGLTFEIWGVRADA